ncbi:hypothetical protein AAGW05_09665 [Arthrobacter sp. LAPM80]|uniref:hypothetical protein n=1 Tax=Arthrobacter sp. LAPM80 TaxID=3141788 RepID=UPI00398B7E62
MVYLVLGVLVAVTAAATLWLVRTGARRRKDPDAAFWYAFAGLCILAPMILIPAHGSNSASVALLAVATASATATDRCARRHNANLSAAALRRGVDAAFAAIAVDHDALIARWSRYELDPALSIDFPTMTDIRIPETSALIRAVASAADLKAASPDTFDGVASYRQGVAELALALATAEEAACGSRTLVWDQ